SADPIRFGSSDGDCRVVKLASIRFVCVALHSSPLPVRTGEKIKVRGLSNRRDDEKRPSPYPLPYEERGGTRRYQATTIQRFCFEISARAVFGFAADQCAATAMTLTTESQQV